MNSLFSSKYTEKNPIYLFLFRIVKHFLKPIIEMQDKFNNYLEQNIIELRNDMEMIRQICFKQEEKIETNTNLSRTTEQKQTQNSMPKTTSTTSKNTSTKKNGTIQWNNFK